MKNLLLLLLSSFVLFSCFKKKVDLDIIESDCKDFKISGATSTLIQDPSCTGLPLMAIYDVTFNYDGDEKCLHKLYLKPQFKDETGKSMSPQHSSEMLFTDSLITLLKDQKKAKFRFKFSFNSEAEATKFDNVFLKFYTENQQGNPSREASIRLDGKCVKPPVVNTGTGTGTGTGTNTGSGNTSGGSSNVKAVYTTTEPEATIVLWDNAAEDGDIVTVYFENKVIIDKYTLRKVKKTFTFPIQMGNNDFILLANNQGSVGPNTCSVIVNGNNQISLNLDLNTGQVIQLIRK